jgi:hypothetical protein
VEQVLPNGVQSWAEVAALYQTQSRKMVHWDHEDVKWYWIEKCCNKFKKPTGAAGDPKRDMILRCQRIQQRMYDKASSVIMGVDSEGDDGLSLDTDAEREDSEEEEDEVALVLGGNLGGANRSNTNTPTVLVDGGLRVAAAE